MTRWHIVVANWPIRAPSSVLLQAPLTLVKREAIRLRCAKRGFECGSTHNYPNLLRNFFTFDIEFLLGIFLVS